MVKYQLSNPHIHTFATAKVQFFFHIHKFSKKNMRIFAYMQKK